MTTFKRFVSYSLLVLLVACGSSGSGPQPDENEAPEAVIRIDAINGLEVSLSAADSNDSDGSIVRYSWDFGDGSSATGETVTHSYGSAGSYAVELTVTDNDDARDQTSETLAVFDGSLSVSPPEPLSSSDDTATFILSNTSATALDWTITLENSSSNPQSGDWFTVSPKSGTIAANGQAEITLSLKSGLAAGSYSSDLSVNYDGGSTEFTVAGSVNSSQQRRVNLEPDNLSLNPSEAGTVTISTSGFSGTATISVARGNDGLDAGQINITDIPTTLAPGETATMTVTPIENADSGTYLIIFTATAGSQSASAELSVTVSEPGGDTASITGRVTTDNADISITPLSVSSQSTPLAQTNQDRPLYVPGQVIVKYRSEALATTSVAQLNRQFIASYGVDVLEAAEADRPALVSRLDLSVPALIKLLERDPRVAYAEPNYYIYTQAIPNDTEIKKLWQLPVSGLPVAWSRETTASNVTIAVIDTGIQTDHPDLQGAFANSGRDFCATSNCLSQDGNPKPDNGEDAHGTHVTGILAARGNNGRGVIGAVYGSKNIVPIKAFDSDSGITTAQALSNAIRWAAGQTVGGSTNPDPADIINLSLGTTANSTTLENAVTYAQGQGALIVASAGNNGTRGVFAPARYDGVLAVGSVNSSLRRSCFSSYGPEIDIMAAGGDGFVCDGPDEAILSTYPGNSYGIEAGTSMATPLVAGIAALVWQRTSSPTPAKVTQALKNTAYKVSYMDSDEYGAGIARADLALGLPGPGSSVSVNADSAAVDTVTLNFAGRSDPYNLTGLEAGDYTLEANASGASLALAGSSDVSLSAGETKQQNIRLARP